MAGKFSVAEAGHMPGMSSMGVVFGLVLILQSYRRQEREHHYRETLCCSQATSGNHFLANEAVASGAKHFEGLQFAGQCFL